METNYSNLTTEQLDMAIEMLEYKNLPEDQEKIKVMKKELNQRKAFDDIL